MVRSACSGGAGSHRGDQHGVTYPKRGSKRYERRGQERHADEGTTATARLPRVPGPAVDLAGSRVVPEADRDVCEMPVA